MVLAYTSNEWQPMTKEEHLKIVGEWCGQVYASEGLGGWLTELISVASTIHEEMETI